MVKALRLPPRAGGETVHGHSVPVWTLGAFGAFLPTWPSCPAMASWRHHERTRPGPAASQRHGRGLGLTEPSRRLPSRCSGGPASEAAVPLGARLPTPPSLTQAERAGSWQGKETSQAAMAAEARRWTLAPASALAPPPAGQPARRFAPRSPPPRAAARRRWRKGYVTAARRWAARGCGSRRSPRRRAWRHSCDAREEGTVEGVKQGTVAGGGEKRASVAGRSERPGKWPSLRMTPH